MKSRFPIPASRPQRVLAAVTFASAVGRGAYLTAGILYFTQAMHLSARQAGIGLSIAGLASLIASPPCGYLADRIGARGVYLAALMCAAVSTAALVLATGFWEFLIAASASASAYTAATAARGPLIARHGSQQPQHFRGYLRGVSNIGISLGAVPAGWAAETGTHAAYTGLILGTAATFLAAAATCALLPAAVPIAIPGRASRPAIKDLPYLTLTGLDGLMSIQFKVLTIALPLWLVMSTSAPRWLISADMLVNTTVVGLLQARAARGIASPAAAGQAMRRAGALFLISCAVIAFAAGTPWWLAAIMLLSAVVIHTIGELWHAAAGFELSFALAPPDAIGQYQGLFNAGASIADLIGPVLLTTLCIEWGRPGWLVIGAFLAVTGLLVPPAVRAAENRTPAALQPAASQAQAAR